MLFSLMKPSIQAHFALAHLEYAAAQSLSSEQVSSKFLLPAGILSETMIADSMENPARRFTF